MAVRGGRCGRAVLVAAVVGLMIGTGVVGCKKQVRPKKEDGSGAGDLAKVVADKVHALDARYRQSFADATRKEPPPEWDPPAMTAAGKSVGPLYEQVQKSWGDIHFLSENGKRLAYHAILDTDEGPIDIELRPDWAPNHVRNFVALARAGYYDGLSFDRIVRQASKKSNDKVELIEGGGPLGLERDQDGIGYWLKDEFNAKLPHEEGVVGATHGEEADTAACKFYIMLCKAPRLDGNYTLFGKVVRGLDVAHRILEKPVQKDDAAGSAADEVSEDVEGGDYHPVKPVVIKKVTIETHEVDKPDPGGDN